MFCAGCGSQIQSGLNYCSRCGRRVAEDATSSNPWSNPLFLAGIVAGVGFIGFIIILRILTRSQTPPNVFAPIAIVYFAALFGICFMLIRHAAAIAKSTVTDGVNETKEPNYLRPATTAQLEEAREFGMGSVTDVTTRTLDKIPIRDDRSK
jgi:hypothetical protein